jgi:hypothetical protein
MSSKNRKSTAKAGTGSLLNSLIDSQKSQKSTRINSNNKKLNDSKESNGIKGYFPALSPSSQNEHNESFSSMSSFDSTVLNADELPDLSQMASMLETRKRSLEERKAKISEIKDVQIKNVLLEIISDVSKCVEDSDKILQCHNELIRRHNEDSNVIISNSRTINNLSKGVGSLVDAQNELKDRVQSLEVTKDCSFDSHFVNIVLVDQKEADDIENGTIGPKQKFSKIMSDLKIVSQKELIDAKLITTRRFINGSRKLIKILKARFGDSITPGRIVAQIITHNKELTKSGKSGLIKYYVETPTSKNVWMLKRICYELKSDGTLHSVRGSDRGILVTYKMKDQQQKDTFRTSVVTSEKDLDELRKLLKVEDAYILVKDKYNADYWNAKKKPEMTQKRGRETDEIEDLNDAKRPSSTPNNQ